MPKGEIPRFENGLINFDELGGYYSTSGRVPFGTFKDKSWKNHHAYYYYELWNQPSRPVDERDYLRIKFRNSRYNRLILKPDDEQRLHDDFREVDPSMLSTYAAEASLRDFAIFDALGTAAVGLCVSKELRNRRQILMEPFGLRMSHIEKQDRVEFFTQWRDESLKQLENPEVTPESVVTSVIKRYAVHLSDPFLAKVATERLTGESLIYPLDLPPLENLKDEAIYAIRQEFPIPFVDREKSEFEKAA